MCFFQVVISAAFLLKLYPLGSHGRLLIFNNDSVFRVFMAKRLLNCGLNIFETLKPLLFIFFFNWRRKTNLHRIADFIVIFVITLRGKAHLVDDLIVDKVSRLLVIVIHDVTFMSRGHLPVVNVLTHHDIALIDCPLTEIVKVYLILRVELVMVSTTQIIHEILVAIIRSPYILLLLLFPGLV
jgi:hypothetical protein